MQRCHKQKLVLSLSREVCGFRALRVNGERRELCFCVQGVGYCFQVLGVGPFCSVQGVCSLVLVRSRLLGSKAEV